MWYRGDRTTWCGMGVSSVWSLWDLPLSVLKKWSVPWLLQAVESTRLDLPIARSTAQSSKRIDWMSKELRQTVSTEEDITAYELSHLAE